MVSARMLVLASAFCAAAGPAAAAKRPAPDPAALVAAASTAFACDLLQRLGDGGGNLVFSPFALSTTLGMTLGGARGRTARQLARALQLGAPGPAVDDGNAALLNAVRACGVSVVGALWAQTGEPFVPAFAARCRTRYDAAVRTVDFSRSPEAARAEINAWARGETANRIEELLGPGTLGPRSRLVLTGAAHLERLWQRPFDRSRTAEGSFHPDRGPAVRVPLMRLDGTFAHHGASDYRAVELPYRGRRLALWVVLPLRVDGLNRLQRSFSARRFTAMLDGAREGGVSVTLPRFRLTGAHRLAGVLVAMGARDAFSDGADLTGMLPGPMKLDDVVQAARLRVDEAGTEAAAATAVTVIEKSAGPLLPFVADHPFLFFLVERSRRVVLFAGRVCDPR